MFRSIINAGTAWGITLAVIAAVNSVIAFVYYFRVVVQMWFKEPAGADRSRIVRGSPGSRARSTILHRSRVLLTARMP